MKTYIVLPVKHARAAYCFDSSAVEVEAESPRQAVERWASSFHASLGHTYETGNTVRVRALGAGFGPDLIFRYTYSVVPIVVATEVEL